MKVRVMDTDGEKLFTMELPEGASVHIDWPDGSPHRAFVQMSEGHIREYQCESGAVTFKRNNRESDEAALSALLGIPFADDDDEIGYAFIVPRRGRDKN